MKLDRLPPDPGAIAGFYEDALTALGAVVERSWYDRIDVLAEGEAARVWNDSGTLHQGELRFPPTDSTGLRDAAVEVFPGCPTTFRLAELLNPEPTLLRRAVLDANDAARRLPSEEVAARTWASCFPRISRFTRLTAFTPTFHFSLAAIVRCEIQAIDQVWSAHRIQVSTIDGRRAPQDSVLSFDPRPPTDIPWPEPDTVLLQDHLAAALAIDLEPELDDVRTRQQRHLTREIQRIDEYFANYEAELRSRRVRGGADPTTARKNLEERIAAARAEHRRRRLDQLDRHAIRITPHVDALLLVAEPAWATRIAVQVDRDQQTHSALFVPYTRHWHLHPAEA